MKKLGLFGLLCFMVLITMFGCSSTSTSNNASPPAGTTTIEVGSGGGATGEAGGTTGTVYTVVLDQASNPLINLLSGNVKITIWVTGEATAECSVVTVTNHSGSAAQAVTYVLTLDRSGSMSYAANASLETAAQNFVDNSGTSDEGAIINFAYSVVVDQVLTTNKSLLKHAITEESYIYTGNTALYDSMYVGIDTVEAGSNPRKAVIAMTDGFNNIYNRTSAEVISHASALGIPIYTVAFGTSVASSELQGIATGTGGFYYNAPTASELNALYTKISSALSSYYTISFTLPSGWTFTAGHTYYITFQVQNYGGLVGSYTFTLTI